MIKLAKSTANDRLIRIAAPKYADHDTILTILRFENYGLNVLRSYIASMICSIAHRSQRSASHERTKIRITPFTLLLDHFLQMLADPMNA
jgi:hypothetical protein